MLFSQNLSNKSKVIRKRNANWNGEIYMNYHVSDIKGVKTSNHLYLMSGRRKKKNSEWSYLH